MIIDQKILDSLTEQAKASPKLRVNFYLRNSSSDLSQRMLNAIEPGSEIAIHRHRHSSETVAVIRGKIREEFFSEDGVLIDSVEVSPGGDAVALSVPIGEWHRSISLESGTVILESKDGPYEPIGEEDILDLEK